MPNKISWSADLQASTREGLLTLSMLPTPAGEVVLKHIDGAFATVTEADFLSGSYKLTDRKSGAVMVFTSVDDLVGAGWALD